MDICAKILYISVTVLAPYHTAVWYQLIFLLLNSICGQYIVLDDGDVATKQRADSYLITGIGQPLLKLGTYHIVHATSEIQKALSSTAPYWVQKGSAVPECRVVDYF